MGVAHNEKCMKYKRQVENLKLDSRELQDKIDILEAKLKVMLSIK